MLLMCCYCVANVLIPLQEREQIKSEHAAMRRILQSHPHEDKPFKDGGGGRTSSVKRELDILQALFFSYRLSSMHFVFLACLTDDVLCFYTLENSIFHRRN